LTKAAGARGEGFQQRDEALRRFGSNRKTALEQYYSYMQQGFDRNNPAEAGILSEKSFNEITTSEKGLPAIIGNPEFVKQAIEKNKTRRMDIWISAVSIKTLRY